MPLRLTDSACVSISAIEITLDLEIESIARLSETTRRFEKFRCLRRLFSFYQNAILDDFIRHFSENEILHVLSDFKDVNDEMSAFD